MEFTREASDVVAAIDDVFPSDDPLDQADFDPVQYINAVFPSEQSLADIDTFIVQLSRKITSLDREVRESVRDQTQPSGNGSAALQMAQAGLAELIDRIKSIQEKMVLEITREIKSLDRAKRNLAATNTALDHLYTLAGAADTLSLLTTSRQYHDAAMLLAAITTASDHFKQHIDIPRIKGLLQRIDTARDTLNIQIVTRFHQVFKHGTPDPDEFDAAELSGACAVIDVLSPDVKDELVAWFVGAQLGDYDSAFPPQAETSWVDKIDRRYAWFKRRVHDLGQGWAGDTFPAEWRILECIALRFCDVTRTTLNQIMTERRADLHVKVFLFAIAKTTQFETWLAARFPLAVREVTEPQAAEPDADVVRINEDNLSDAERVRLKYLRHRQTLRREEQGATTVRTVSRFNRAISSEFDGFMDVYVAAQDQALSSMMTEFIREFKNDTVKDADGTEDAHVFQSCGDMFLFFKHSLLQCAQLSAGASLVDLCRVFKRHLSVYCRRMLSERLPRVGTLPSLLLKGGEMDLSQNGQYLACCILNTAEYSLETTKQLERHLRELVGTPQQEPVNLGDEQDQFQEVISMAVQVLVRGLETQLEPALALATKTKWDAVEEVGDTSLFVSLIGRQVAQTVPFIRACLSSTRKYFVNFCLKFASSFIPRLIDQVYKCKHVSATGAGQLLLDVQSVRIVLLELPCVGSGAEKTAPLSYTKFVVKGMATIETVLKVLMIPHDTPQLFVEKYIEHVGLDGGLPAFKKLLDMRGVGKTGQAGLLACFRGLTSDAATA